MLDCLDYYPPLVKGMPKGFNEHEKTAIREALLEQGRLALARYGVRRTSVEELTRAVGISKGAFYLFFESKESLFLEIFRRFEQEYRERILALAARPGPSPHARFIATLTEAFAALAAEPLMSRFGQAEYAALVLRLPAEALAAGQEDDARFVARLLETWAAAGVRVDCAPSLFAEVLRALFLVLIHRDEFGGAACPPALIALIEGLAVRYVKGQDDDVVSAAACEATDY